MNFQTKDSTWHFSLFAKYPADYIYFVIIVRFFFWHALMKKQFILFQALSAHRLYVLTSSKNGCKVENIILLNILTKHEVQN